MTETLLFVRLGETEVC